MRPHRAGRRRAIASLLVTLIVAACGSSPPPRVAPGISYTPVSFGDLPGWSADDPRSALAAFLRSCTRWQRYDRNRPVGPEAITMTAAAWHGTCSKAERVAPYDANATREFFEKNFTAHSISNSGQSTGVITGYYEPELRGSRVRTSRYRYPLYRLPPEPRGDGRHPSRAQIEGGALAGRGLELLWVDDPVDLFFLHIQGSGRVLLEDGTAIRVGYGGQNGHGYVSIGRLLLDRGAFVDGGASMQSIKAWLRLNPDKADAVMNENPSYVFFRLIDGDGPIGAQGVVLSPQRSLAIDPAFVPLGAPVWLDTVEPLEPNVPMRRLMVAQDTGGAIKGANRADLFWGTGEAAGDSAGRMYRQGRLIVLLPRAG
jgi:membrane-bound lytic murein transglycosylase A